MHSPREIQFRLRQELGDLGMWAFPPRLPAGVRAPSPLEGLPGPAPVADALRGTPFVPRITAIAEELLAHRFPLLGLTIAAGAEIRWRRDYVHGIETPLAYFRRTPYLDFARAGDHKIVWELNRHQHLVLLAQAWLLTGREEFFGEISSQLESWWGANPFLRGMNWTSALEVGFRALSWIWIYHLAGHRMAPGFRQRFLEELYRHGRFLERNLSFYFSPNTHLLGEAVALHALGALLPGLPRAAHWTRLGSRIVQDQMTAQVREDGSHFEQSAYYHLYALDMFLFHYVLAGKTAPGYGERLFRMAEYLDALEGPAGVLPFIGDEDGGRFFHPYGIRRRFGRATLATCAALFGEPRWPHAAEDLWEQAAWWIGPKALEPRQGSAPAPRASRLFADAGTAVMESQQGRVIVKAGGFAPGSGGHSHSDILSVTAWACQEEILTDPGTFTYIADPAWRDRFRGSAAHNTVRIDGRDQAEPVGPFRWARMAQPEILAWNTGAERDSLDAVCECGGFRHRRRVVFLKPDLLMVLDEISGREGEHELEQFWHLGGHEAGMAKRLAIAGGGRTELLREGEYGWISPVFGVKEPAGVICVRLRTRLPALMAAVWDLSDAPGGARAVLLDGPAIQWEGRRTVRVRFEDAG